LRRETKGLTSNNLFGMRKEISRNTLLKRNTYLRPSGEESQVLLPVEKRCWKIFYGVMLGLREKKSVS